MLSEREVSPQLGLLKSTLLQLDSTFSERNYGAGSFRDFVEKLAKRRRASRVHQGKGGWLVGAGRRRAPRAEAAPMPRRGAAARRRRASRRQPRTSRRTAPAQPAASRRPPVLGTPADGVREFRALLGRGADPALADVSAQREAGVPPGDARRSTNGRTDSAIWSICCAPRRRTASSASTATGRA